MAFKVQLDVKSDHSDAAAKAALGGDTLESTLLAIGVDYVF